MALVYGATALAVALLIVRPEPRTGPAIAVSAPLGVPRRPAAPRPHRPPPWLLWRLGGAGPRSRGARGPSPTAWSKVAAMVQAPPTPPRVGTLCRVAKPASAGHAAAGPMVDGVRIGGCPHADSNGIHPQLLYQRGAGRLKRVEHQGRAGSYQ